jgi:hypothetical protein
MKFALGCRLKNRRRIFWFHFKLVTEKKRACRFLTKLDKQEGIMKGEKSPFFCFYLSCKYLIVSVLYLKNKFYFIFFEKLSVRNYKTQIILMKKKV